MKRNLTHTALVLFLLTLTAVPVYAARPTGTPGTQRYGQVQQRTERRMNMTSGMIAKFRQRLDRYQDFLTKVETRKAKLADQGVNVTNITAFITKAKENVKKTKTAIDTAETNLNAIDYSQPMNEVMTRVRDELRKVRQAMTTLHTSMSQAVREIRQKT